MSYAIQAEGLGKRYRIGSREARPDTLTGASLSWLRSPLDNLRRLRRLTRFDEADGDDVLWALRDVSFAIEEGDVWGVIGHNGAGKSTLLKILSRITEPSAGWVKAHGRVASLLEVGTGFHPELTGRENVYLNGTILGMSKAEVDRSFDEIVAFAEVDRFIDTPVKHYSSGMSVRLAFAIAAHLRAEILLVDEVLAVGDVAFQRKCLGKMEAVAGQGRTVILVSHDMASIRRLCRWGMMLDDGRTVAEGPIEEVVDQYLEQVLGGAGDAAGAATEAFSIESVTITADGGPVIKTYDDVEVRVSLVAKRAIALPGLYVAILGADQARIAGLDLRDFLSPEPMAIGERRQLGFRIERLPLLPGHYQLELYTKDMAGPTIERVERWFSFDIAETAVYGRAAPTRWNGKVALDAAAFAEEDSSADSPRDTSLPGSAKA